MAKTKTKASQKIIAGVQLTPGLFWDKARHRFRSDGRREVDGVFRRMPRGVVLKPANGHPTKSEALEAVRLWEETLRDWLEGYKAPPVTSGPRTLRTVTDDYYTDMLHRGKAAGTIAEKRQEIERHFLPLFDADMPIAQFGAADLDRYLAERIEGGALRSVKTKFNRYHCPSALFRFAAERGYIKSSPFTRRSPRRPKLNRANIGTLTRAQRRAAVEAAQAIDKGNGPDAACCEVMVRLAIGQGLRRGEVTSLDVEEFDFAAGKIHLRDQEKYPYLAGYRKSGARTVTLFRSVAVFLKTWIAEHRPNGGPLFPGKKNRYVYLSRCMTLVGKRAGLDANLRGFNVTRHTFATSMLGSGKMTMRELQLHLGHENIRQTETYLADVENPEATRKHNEGADQLFGDVRVDDRLVAAMDLLGLDEKQRALFPRALALATSSDRGVREVL